MKKILLFLSLFLYSFSCDPYDSNVDPTQALTESTWQGWYKDHFGSNIEHIIQFEALGRGSEWITDRDTGEEYFDSFRWYWENNYTQIRFDYGNREIFFTNVYVTYISLTGKIEGVDVHFTAY